MRTTVQRNIEYVRKLKAKSLKRFVKTLSKPKSKQVSK